MDYISHKKKYPKDVLVYVEEFNKVEKSVLFDFFNSKEYDLFTNLTDRVKDSDKPSMILLNGYKGKTIQENTLYAIKPTTLQSLNEHKVFDSEIPNSFLIGYKVDIGNIDKDIFSDTVSVVKFPDFSDPNYHLYKQSNPLEIPLHHNGRLSFTVRNVGQGNWNEIWSDDEVIIVYDVGANMHASKALIRDIIGDRNILYNNSKPILILSHWDKDHYHSLLGMSDAELKSNFSAFVCRDFFPNKTSAHIFDRVITAIGGANIYSLSAEPKEESGPIRFIPLTHANKQIGVYNAQYHKNRNISGIALSVKTLEGSVILAGDAHYEQISRDILPDLNYKHQHHLVVPHHGGKAGYYTYHVPPNVSVENAVISVGVNSYKHPNPDYVDALELTGFKVKQTRFVGQDITIDLL